MTVDGVVIGQRIADARRRRNWTQADLAHASDLERSALAKIETGGRRVSALELARVSAALDERIEWFLDDPPDALVSHRNTLEPGESESTIDAELDHLVRDVEFVRGLATATGAARVAPPFARPDDIAALERDALRVRDLLNLRPGQPMLECGRAAEALGICAFSLLLPDGAADAATVLLDRGAVSLVNGRLHVGRRRLSLAHEIGHYVYADDYTVDWRIGHETADSWESRLDRFARALLLPESGVREQWEDLVARENSLRSCAVRTASDFRVDMATLARRLDELGILDPEDARLVRTFRTTKADIVEYDLVVSDELGPPSLPRGYQLAVLAAVRTEKVAPERAVELLRGSFDFDSLPVPTELPLDAVWQFV